MALRVSRRRAREILGREPALADAMASPADVEALTMPSAGSAAQLAAAFARYATRPCLGEREAVVVDGERRLLPTYRTITYGALWRRAEALATAWSTEGLVRRGDFVGLCGFASIDWIVADLACLYLGAISVPLQSTMAARELEHVIGETGLVALVCAVEDLPAVAEVVARCESLRSIALIDTDRPHATPSLPSRISLHEIAALETRGLALPKVALVSHARDADPLVTIVYTSGSTGLPKGVLYPDRRWGQRLQAALGETPMPVVTVGYLPLAHMAGRLTAYRIMMRGGVTYFVPARDMSTLFDDIRAVRPTVLTLVPRVSGMIYQHFQAELVRRGVDHTLGPDAPETQEVMLEMRHGFLGDRLCRIDTGAAPTAPEILSFLERCFDISVLNAYGATELGLVTVNGQVQPGIEYKLVDVPELGYRTSDRPFPRGELLVRSPHKAPGYFKNEAASERLRDDDGYLHSGDIVEERGPGQVVWIDRKNNILRLAQGEFVSLTQLEELFVTKSPFIEQAFVYGNSHRAYLLAVIVPAMDAVRASLGVPTPDDAAIDALLRAEIDRIAVDAKLPSHERPRAFVLEHTPFSADNGLLTESNKPRRPRLKDRYGERLEQLYTEIEARQLVDLQALLRASTRDERVRGALAVALGLPIDTLVASEERNSFVGLGGDSLAAVRLGTLLTEVAGCSPPTGLILDRQTTLSELRRWVEAHGTDSATVSYAKIHGDGREILASDLQLDRFMTLDSAATTGGTEAPRDVLLTGANGFLGRFLLVELLARVPGRVTCIVRASSDAEARARIEASLRSDGGSLLPATDRLQVLAGDLMRPRLGLDEARYGELAEREDAVVHNGALVNHALSYPQLFEPNVLGTVEVMRLSIARKRKAIHFVSTIGVAAGHRDEVFEREDAAALATKKPLGAGAADYGVGYSTSKWAGELLLGQLAARAGVPVSIYRCAMILGHQRAEQVNEGDMVTRLLYGILRTGVAPESFYPPAYRAARHFDGIPVDVVAAAIAGIASAPTAGTSIFHVSNPHREDGVSLDRIVDWTASAGYPVRRLPYADWYRAFGDGLQRLDEARRRRSPLSVLERWRHPMREALALHMSTQRFVERLRTLDLTVPRLDEPYVHHLLRSIDRLDA